MAKVCFGAGAELETTASAMAVIELLVQIAGGQRGNDQGRPLPAGDAALHTDHGPVYVQAARVPYVRD